MKENVLTCIGCPIGCELHVRKDLVVTGNQCPIGERYGRNEINNPLRMVTTTLIVSGSTTTVVPVKTSGEIPKGLVLEVAKSLKGVIVEAPINCGDILVENILNSGTDIIATSEVKR